MKSVLSVILMLGFIATGSAQKNSSYSNVIADSLKALSFYTEVSLQPGNTSKKGYAGVVVDEVEVRIERKGSGILVLMNVPEKSKVVTSGIGVQISRKNKLALPVINADTGTYKIMLVKAVDSSGNFSLVSGYVFFSQLQKWKLVATARQTGHSFLHTSTLSRSTGKGTITNSFLHTAVQRSNGSWRSVEGKPTPAPAISYIGEPDSTHRAEADKKLIDAMADKQTIGIKPHEGLYYIIEKMGTGRFVKATDTVTVFYKGRLLGDTAMFDQTAVGKPARFPLSRLIRGWQIGLPLIKEGGTIRLVIPSGLAYSIRTRSPKIPPNSILVFDIEVVKAEPVR